MDLYGVTPRTALWAPSVWELLLRRTHRDTSDKWPSRLSAPAAFWCLEETRRLKVWYQKGDSEPSDTSQPVTVGFMHEGTSRELGHLGRGKCSASDCRQRKGHLARAERYMVPAVAV
jgi:hypothetical protein